MINVIIKIFVNEYDKKLNLADNPLFGKLKNLANLRTEIDNSELFVEEVQP